MKYVLMFIETEQFAADLAAMDDDARGKAYAAVDAWFAQYGPHIRGAAKLAAPETATTVRVDGAAPVVLDGPFVEGKEVVSGYAEIKVPGLDEAIAMAKAWPGCPVVEIRPVQG